MSDLLAGIIGIAGEYVRSEVRVTVETNMLPALTIYSGSMSPGGGGAAVASIADALGIRAGVVVRNAKGDVLAQFGDPAPASLWRVGLVVCAIGAVGWLIVKVIR